MVKTCVNKKIIGDATSKLEASEVNSKKVSDEGVGRSSGVARSNKNHHKQQ
ncbi:MAG: hypothetical protein VX737_06500 [Pseudomonadota bacterium]|nr:hypothetical protein [Pseudomonadota bacterium]